MQFKSGITYGACMCSVRHKHSKVSIKTAMQILVFSLLCIYLRATSPFHSESKNKIIKCLTFFSYRKCPELKWMNTGSRMAVTGTADDQLKTVACSGCGDEFSTKFTLKRHVSVHTVQWYTVCMNVLQRSCKSGTGTVPMERDVWVKALIGGLSETCLYEGVEMFLILIFLSKS